MIEIPLCLSWRDFQDLCVAASNSPLFFSFDSTVAASSMLADATGLEASYGLGELSNMKECIGRKVGVGLTIVFAIMRRYPGAIQVIAG